MKRKIWLPLLTIGATTAVVVPAITSCRPGLMGTHDMLNPDYIHHVLPSAARTIKGSSVDPSLYINTYFKDVAEDTDILKDDILFTYSKVLTNDTYKAKLDFDFTRYFLYVDDIKVDLDKNTVDMKLWAEITGTTARNLDNHKTTDGTKYLRDFTLILGAHYSSPLNISTNSLIAAEDTGPFKDLYGMNLRFDTADTSAIRVVTLGTVGLSDTSTGTITQTTIDVDETSYIKDKSDYYRLFYDLIYSIPSTSLNVSLVDSLSLVSYYFKNVKFTA